MTTTTTTTKLYLLTFPNDKHYVGITCMSMRLRLRCHRNAKSGIVRYAMRKHGMPAVTVLAAGSREEMAELERFLIKDGKTRIPNGYNITDGGDGFTSEEMQARWADPAFRKKASEAMRGKRKVPDHHSNWLRKITKCEADQIRLRVAGGEVQRQLAKEFGVSPATVCLIVKGDRYAV